MPQRSRTHQLEDKSINEFKRLLPEQWVCREKGRDYGVDLEVEIFDDTGQATGFFFYVQLKATDDAEKFDKVTVKIDRLNYLASLNVPAIIARYCEPTNGWKWIWNHEAFAQVGQDAQTVSLDVPNDWTQETPSGIASYINALRRMQNADQNESVFIEVENHTASFAYFSACEKVLREYSKMLSFIKFRKGDTKSLSLKIQLKDGFLRIDFAHVGYLDIKVDEYSLEKIAAALVYGVPAVLLKMGLSAHAKSAALFCLRENIRTQQKGLALEVCRALLGDPQNATDLAILNDVHAEQDNFYGSFVMSLMGSNGNDNRVSQALEKLNGAAAEAAIERGRNPSTIFYSLGNSQASMGLYRHAIRSFNRARKFEPDYLSRFYFLSELGGSLFFANKYKCAVRAYEAAFSIEKTATAQFRLADARLYTGSFEEAAAAFEEIEQTSEASLSAEIRLKTYLTKWLIWSNFDVKPSDAKKLHTIMVESIEREDLLNAHCALLALALLTPQMPEPWAGFLHICFLISEHEMMLDAMTTAYVECGAEAYSICRQRLLDANQILEESTAMEELDALFAEARRIGESRAPAPVTFRVIGQNGPEVIFTKK
ncbi:Tetratricopeptide repeat-containing protein [Ensifer adhaerens]|nr:Tetratricopeptide repeat-containing protein [Ensifer adhaerens]